ncbi:MAG: hypothetical protein ACPGNT_02070 [Rhodospirillales bacterium]
MQASIPLSALDVLMAAGLLADIGYIAYRRQQGSPVAAFIRLERSIRVKLRDLGHQEDKDAELHRRKAFKLGSGSEKLLRWAMRLADFSLVLGGLVAFGLLCANVFVGGGVMTPLAAILLIAVVWLPVPLSLLTLQALARLYLGRLQSEIRDLLQSLGQLDGVKEQYHGGGPAAFLALALEALEDGAGRNKGKGPGH